MKRITLYRHEDCVRCAKMAKMHMRLDWLRRLECSTDEAPSGPLKMGEIEVRDEHTGATFKGIAAVRQVAKQIPAYWPLLPLLHFPPIAKKIDAMTSGCEDGGCALPKTEAREEEAARAGR